MKSEFVKKSWGWELWFANVKETESFDHDNNTDPIIKKIDYCGKLLFVEHGQWSSKGKYHYHKIKDETFFITEGLLQLDFIDENDRPDTKILSPMNTFRLKPGVKHRFTSVSKTGCKFIEVSTFHSNDDSYRGRIDFETGEWQEME